MPTTHVPIAITTDSLLVSAGKWESGPFTVQPSAWYRLQFRVKVAGPAYWTAVMFDAQGVELPDHYDGIAATEEWQVVSSCFRSKDQAATARIRFQLIREPLEVADAVVTPVEIAEVLDFADRVYAGIPPIACVFDPQRWHNLPKTRQKLLRGEHVRCVTLGDSIMNDIHNAPWEVLIGRNAAPGGITLISAVRGSMGCRYYLNPDVLAATVLQRQPDLALISARSSRVDYDAIRALVHALRTEHDIEVLLTSDPFGSDGDPRMTEDIELPSNWTLDFADHYVRIAEEEHIAFLDLHHAWKAYIATSNRPYHHFLRDLHHANTNGRQVVARMLEGFFRV